MRTPERVFAILQEAEELIINNPECAPFEGHDCVLRSKSTLYSSSTLEDYASALAVNELRLKLPGSELRNSYSHSVLLMNVIDCRVHLKKTIDCAWLNTLPDWEKLFMEPVSVHVLRYIVPIIGMDCPRVSQLHTALCTLLKLDKITSDVPTIMAAYMEQYEHA